MELDNDYANAAHIADGDSYPQRWAAQAAAFRAQAGGQHDLPYGQGARHKFDLFTPAAAAKGTVIFVHGGYWRMSDKSDWSHLAAGPLARGWAVAIPSYDLCPTVSIPQIGAQITTAIGVIAARLAGPLRLIGHSAGGQLVASVTQLAGSADWLARVRAVVPISPIADLAPLMRTGMNADLGITAAIAATHSPIHLPAPQMPVTVWVGADERPAFVAQAAALGQAWGCPVVQKAGRHHFDVIADLTRSSSALTATLLA